MTKQLVSVLQFVKDAKDRGDDLNELYLDPDDIVELDDASDLDDD